MKQVVELEEAVAVVADSYWRARKALAALGPVYDDAGHGDVSSETIFAAFDAALGPAPEMPAEAATVITADYRVPFLAHATMESMACTVRVEDGRADVWAGTQDPLNARSIAAGALDFDTDQVRLTNLMLGGGYGRRLPFSFDYVDLAAHIAKAMSPAPVKLVWSRENDIQHDYYRPAAMCRYAGALDAAGRPLAVGAHYAGGGDGESLFMPYAIADLRFDGRGAAHHIREGAWRSVLNSQHGFFKESFIDELAHAAGTDPYAFRRELMDDRGRRHLRPLRRHGGRDHHRRRPRRREQLRRSRDDPHGRRPARPGGVHPLGRAPGRPRRARRATGGAGRHQCRLRGDGHSSPGSADQESEAGARVVVAILVIGGVTLAR